MSAKTLVPVLHKALKESGLVIVDIKRLEKLKRDLETYIDECDRLRMQLALARHDPAEMARLGLSMDGDANRDLTARMLLVRVLEHNVPLPKLKAQIQELLGDY